jgi:hypothetical protein
VLLRDRPLSSYYDEVALKGLQLAANDAARGVLTEAQLEKIKLSMQADTTLFSWHFLRQMAAAARSTRTQR